MKQVRSKNRGIKETISKKKKTAVKSTAVKKDRKHPKFGTSKLEEDFANDFLDKLGIKYQWQFEAKEIGRFYDFSLFPNNGGMILLEIDGGYFHSDPRLVKEEEMNPMQKRNKRVDELKNKWALMHGIPIMRIWEKDIRESPKEVMKKLKERLYIEDKKQQSLKEMNKRHINKIK